MKKNLSSGPAAAQARESSIGKEALRENKVGEVVRKPATNDGELRQGQISRKYGWGFHSSIRFYIYEGATHR